MPKFKKNQKIIFVCNGHPYDLKRGRIVGLYGDVYSIKLDGVSKTFSVTDTHVREDS